MAMSEILDTNMTFVRPKRQKTPIPARIMREKGYYSWPPNIWGHTLSRFLFIFLPCMWGRGVMGCDSVGLAESPFWASDQNRAKIAEK